MIRNGEFHLLSLEIEWRLGVLAALWIFLSAHVSSAVGVGFVSGCLARVAGYKVFALQGRLGF
jgi:hypothetical protein